jgi:hypothetical protein
MKPIIRSCEPSHNPRKPGLQPCGCNPMWDAINARLVAGEITLPDARLALGLSAHGGYAVFGTDPDYRQRRQYRTAVPAVDVDPIPAVVIPIGQEVLPAA